MSNAEHPLTSWSKPLSPPERGVDLVPVVADSTSTAKIAPFIKQFWPAGERFASPIERATVGAPPPVWRAGRESGGDL